MVSATTSVSDWVRHPVGGVQDFLISWKLYTSPL